MKRGEDSPIARRGAASRDLRQRQTPAEAALWAHLRRNQLGVPFRRQHPIGPFVVDFCCLPAQLVIELDGSVHELEDVREQDSWRTEYLLNHGFTVHRFSNAAALTKTDDVIATIRSLIT